VFVVDFGVTDSNSDGLVEFSTCDSIKLIDGSGQNSAVLKDGRASSHGVCFAGSGLAVAENGAIEAFSSRLDNFLGGCFVSFILGGVMQ